MVVLCKVLVLSCSTLCPFWLCNRKLRGLVALLLLFSECHVLCNCSLPLPRAAVGWSVVCDCGISWSYSLTFRLMDEKLTTILHSSIYAEPKREPYILKFFYFTH